MSEVRSTADEDVETWEDSDGVIITEADAEAVTSPADTEQEPTVEIPEAPAQEPSTLGDNQVGQQLEQLTTAVSTLQDTVSQFTGQQQALTALNFQLQTRIEELEKDQVRSLLKPIFERLASLYTQASEASADTFERDRESAEDFGFFGTSILELMELYDVVSVEADVGVAFDPKLHAAVRRKSTDDPTLDGLIARVQRQGFTFAGDQRVLLPARVVVHRYVSTPASA